MDVATLTWKRVVIIVCGSVLVYGLFVCVDPYNISLPVRRFKPEYPHELKQNNTSYNYNNEAKRFVNSSEQVMRTILDIRYKNSRLDPSSSIQHACDEERAKELLRRDYTRTKLNTSVHLTRQLPSCIIIGTFKSGTREFIDYLYMNPRIVIKREPLYEISFFDTQAYRGLEWYRNQMPPSVPGQITVEKSPSYFYSEETPKRIHAMNSSIKLILLVRDPVDRAMSHFNFRQSFKKYSGSFSKCAINKVTAGINENCPFLKQSVYDMPIARYLKYFNRDQIHIISDVEFRKNPLKVLQEVEDYLAIPHLIRMEYFVYNAHRNIFCLRSVNNEGICYSTERGRGSYTATLSPGLRQRLVTWFKPHNEKFFRLINRSFPWP